MTVKKPLLLIVLILALLMTGLVVPATAFGVPPGPSEDPQGNKPLACVTYAGVNFPAPGIHRQQSLSLRWYGEDVFKGHMILQNIKPLEGRMMLVAAEGDFEYVSHTANTFTFEARFDLWVPGADDPIPDWVELTCTFTDGGPGSDGDWLSIDGGPIHIEGSPERGNIVVHIMQ